MRYINKFSTADDIKTAVEEGALGNPFIAYAENEDKIYWNKTGGDEPAPIALLLDFIPIHLGDGIVNNNTKVETQFKILDVNPQNLGNMTMFGNVGAWNESYTFRLNYCYSASGSIQKQFRTYVGGKFNDNAGTGELDTVHNITLTRSSFTLNGTTTSIAATGDLSGELNVNGLNSTVSAKMELYYMKIYNGSTLVYDLIPWVNAAGNGCLKDTISGQLFDAEDPSKATALFDEPVARIASAPMFASMVDLSETTQLSGDTQTTI